MARKAWGELSQTYRDRLSAKGITREMHAAGESIRHARGHEHTPEHPKEGIKRADQFPEWFLTRERLVKQVVSRKSRLFGSSKKYNRTRAAKQVMEGPDGGKPPSSAMLQWALDADESELIEAMQSGDQEYAFLYYH